MNGIVLIRNLEASEKLLYTLLDQHQKARQKTNCLSILLILPDPFIQQARLAQSVEHETLNLRVVGSSPTLGEYSFFTLT